MVDRLVAVANLTELVVVLFHPAADVAWGVGVLEEREVVAVGHGAEAVAGEVWRCAVGRVAVGLADRGLVGVGGVVVVAVERDDVPEGTVAFIVVQRLAVLRRCDERDGARGGAAAAALDYGAGAGLEYVRVGVEAEPLVVTVEVAVLADAEFAAEEGVAAWDGVAAVGFSVGVGAAVVVGRCRRHGCLRGPPPRGKTLVSGWKV